MAKGEKRRLGFLSRKVTDLESTVRHQQETIRTLAAALQHQAYSNQLILSVFHTQNEHALGKLTPHEPTPSFQFTVPAAPARPEPGHDLTECPDAGGVLLAPPSAHGHYAREICRTVSNVAAEQAVTHGPATPAATTDADIGADIPTSSHDSFMGVSEPPPITTTFNAHQPAAPPTPSLPAVPKENDTLHQLYESFNDMSYIDLLHLPIKEQRCQRYMIGRFLHLTTEEDRQRDQNFGSKIFSKIFRHKKIQCCYPLLLCTLLIAIQWCTTWPRKETTSRFPIPEGNGR